MRNIKRIIIYGVLAVLTLSFIYIVYPRRGTLENMVLENYKTKEFTYGKLRVEDEDYTLAEYNNEKIEEFLNEIKGIKIKEISNIKEEDIDEVYNLKFYGGSEDLGLVIFDFKYIKIFGSAKGRHRNAIYKILNDEDKNLLKEKLEAITLLKKIY